MTPFEPARAPHGVPGMFILAPDTDLTICTPGWNGPTYFMPVGSPQPGMSDADDDNWYHGISDLIRGAGTLRPVSFLNTPSDLDFGDFELTPYDLLRQTAWRRSLSTHPQWQALFQHAKHRPALPNPNRAVLMQGMLYRYPKVPYWTAPIDNALLLLSLPLTIAVRKLLCDDAIVEELFYPDVAAGRPTVLRFYRHPGQALLPAEWTLVRESPAWIPSGEHQRKPHLLCELVRPTEGVRLSFPSPVDRALALKPWSTVIRRLTVAEQLRCLSTAFDPDLIRAAFLDSRYEPDLPQWLVETATPRSAW